MQDRIGYFPGLRTLRSELAADLVAAERHFAQGELALRRVNQKWRLFLGQEDWMGDEDLRLMPVEGTRAVLDWIEARGSSQRWLSREIGRSHVHLGEVLRRKEGCSAEMAREIARVTGLAEGLLLPPAHASAVAS